MGYAFGSAIHIAYGNHDGSDEDGHDGARSAVRSGQAAAAPPKQLLLTKPIH